MSTGDFWDEMAGAYVQATSFDSMLQEHELDGPAFTSVRDLTDAAKVANALPLPVEAGTRVRFVANLGSVLSYSDIPDPKIAGTVITVRSGAGDCTSQDDRVFVAWDDGVFRAIAPEHLRMFNSSKRANNVRMVVSDLGDLSMFFNATSRADELVHKATKDLWAVKTEAGGKFVIQRLFKDNGEPLKV
jgi:hypothetical protein